MSKTLIGIIAVVVLIGGLFALGRMSDPNADLIKKWNDIGVACLPNGHQNLAQHIHASIEISADGKKEVIPANTGIVSTCMAEMHTHETDGIVHIETAEKDATFTLGQFFQMLDKGFERPGFALKVTVDGNASTEFEKLVLADKQVIKLEYTPVKEAVNQ